MTENTNQNVTAAATATFTFKYQGKSYTFTGEPAQVANQRKSFEAAEAKMLALVEKSVKRGPGRPGVAKEQTLASKIRDWAKEAGVEVGKRGAIAPEIVGQYYAAQAGK